MAGDQSSTERQSEQAEVRIGWKMAGLGMEVATQAGGGALLGWLYDSWRGSGTNGILIGAIIGITAGLFSLIRGGLKFNKQLDELAQKRKTERNQKQDTLKTTTSKKDDWDNWNDDDWSDTDNDDHSGA